MARKLTSSEGERIEDYIGRWMRECQRWVDKFEEHANRFRSEWSEMHTGIPSSTDLVMAATYFVMTAGCVYMHCQTLLEVKLKKEDKAKKEMKRLRDKWPVLETLYKHRNWMNHGPLHENKDYGVGFEMYKGLDKTFEEMSAEAEIKGESVMGQVIRFSWTDRDGQPTDDVSEWQKNVVLELSRMIEYVKGFPWS